MATRIDGKALAAKVKAQTAEAAKSLYRRPGLAVILVGNDPASRVYAQEDWALIWVLPILSYMSGGGESH